MASLLTTQREYRRRLLAHDREAARALVRVYADIESAISAELDALTRRIRAAQAAGETVNRSWLFQEQRYRSLLQQAADAYQVAAQQAAGTVTATQRSAQQLGVEAAEQLVRSMAPPQIPLSWSTLPSVAIQAFVGYASDGSPLSKLFDALGPEGSAGIRSALTRGLALGYSPRKIAAGVRDQVGISLTRALTISRTEVLRSYRQSQSDGYAANRDIVTGKMWYASLIGACPVCVSMHGSIHGVNEIMATHPNCRCSWIPVTKSWQELGFDVPDTNPKIERGADWFARQPAERQVAMLGRERQAAYANGLTLAEMVGRRVDRRWGPVRYTLPLREALRRRRVA